MIIYVVVGLFCAYKIYLWYKKQSLEPPELPGKLPLVGHGHWFLGDSVAMYDTIKTLSEKAREQGGIVRFYPGPRNGYAVVDPEAGLTIATSCLQKHYVYDFGKPLFGNGLLNADVVTWKVHRRLLNPAFSQQVLDGFIDVFNSQAQRLVEQFAACVGKLFDHDTLLRINNLETVCSAATGVNPNDYDNLMKQYLPHFEAAIQIFNIRFNKFWLHSDFVYNWSSLKKKQDVEIEYIAELANSILQKKRSELKNPVNKENKPGKLKPFIDLILELAKDIRSFTDEQIRGETNTIIGGGHDTTASALTFAFTLLGSYPEVQEKAYDEILSVIGNSGRDVNKDDLSKLIYIEAILKETLRLYPSVPVIARQLDKDIKIKNYTLKANNPCFMSIYGFNRDKMWGADANEFRPERWLDKETLPDPKFYSPFGLGRRSCIGKMYAMMSMKIILVHVLRRYHVSSDIRKMVVRMDTLIRPASGHHIKLSFRDN